MKAPRHFTYATHISAILP